ncbi:HTH domain-containing protein [Natranaeroarchaeum aerophilus]|uniref:Uncharacterized protein n=1 Tax=Natranaeroarchaeum aerophilus TaxID=2917711 RepID=A0AAE3K5N0_9EURY|nr:HTH domain-containing protein [Natranaeroarchaeum aerophilus]MCL9813520.1 hypothetical protein [Natranaeroarchaeum aerophilus]
MSTRSEPLDISVYVRPAQLVEPIDSKIETVRQLESEGTIESASVHAWPDKIVLSERTPYTGVIDAFREMEAWADDHDVSIQPPFDVRTTTSSFTGERRTILRTPVICLTVYAGGQLSNVFPHSRSGERYSVTDAIAALRTDSMQMFSLEPTAPRQLPDRCCACDELLTNVQGIGVCQECDRIEYGPGTRRRLIRRPPPP